MKLKFIENLDDANPTVRWKATEDFSRNYPDIGGAALIQAALYDGLFNNPNVRIEAIKAFKELKGSWRKLGLKALEQNLIHDHDFPEVARVARDVLQEMSGTMTVEKADFIDLLIVCGQGSFESGFFYGEFNNREVYLGHAKAVPDLFQEFNYNLIVLSGGFTQAVTPWLSEAQSFLNMWQITGIYSIPDVGGVVADEIALDSAENLFLGLMAARLWLKNKGWNIPIRRVGVFAAWHFKKWRFTRNAEGLGIINQFYFHSYADEHKSDLRVPQSQPDLATYTNDKEEIILLRNQKNEEKRQRRWWNNPFDSNGNRIDFSGMTNRKLWTKSVTNIEANPEEVDIVTMYNDQKVSKYSQRLQKVRAAFPRVWEELDNLEKSDSYPNPKLQEAFSEEVMSPSE